MIETILWTVLLSLPSGGFVAVVILVLRNPEKIEKWSALLWRVLAGMGSLFKAAQRTYVKHDLQGRVNDFVRRLRRQVPTLAEEKLRIEWVDASVERKSFIADGSVVIRLRRDDPHDHNFVHGSLLYVSSSLLRKAKRYLSPSQGEALDLYVCSTLLNEEKHAVVSFFLDEYLHPGTVERKSKVSEYIDDFAQIDAGGLFSPVLLQELEYLGEKVFGRRKDAAVIAEVNGLITFLKPIANRKLGEEGDLDFDGSYCRFGIVIIGKKKKLLESIDPYAAFIRKVLVKNGAETIYLLARPENHSKLEAIASEFELGYSSEKRAIHKAKLRNRAGEAVPTLRYMLVLRKRGVALVQPSVR